MENTTIVVLKVLSEKFIVIRNYYYPLSLTVISWLYVCMYVKVVNFI